MRTAHSSERLILWQLADQLRSEVLRLTKSDRLYFDRRVRLQIEDSATEVGRNVERALATDHTGEFGRFVRLARSAVGEVQAGLRVALLKRYIAANDATRVGELLSRLYPALSSLLPTASCRSETPGQSPSCSHLSAAPCRTESARQRALQEVDHHAEGDKPR